MWSAVTPRPRNTRFSRLLRRTFGVAHWSSSPLTRVDADAVSTLHSFRGARPAADQVDTTFPSQLMRERRRGGKAGRHWRPDFSASGMASRSPALPRVMLGKPRNGRSNQAGEIELTMKTNRANVRVGSFASFSSPARHVRARVGRQACRTMTAYVKLRHLLALPQRQFATD